MNPTSSIEYDSSDDNIDNVDDDVDLDRFLLLNETTCDVSTRDTYFMKLYEFYKTKRDETMAVCCQTLGIANGIEANYSFEKRPFDLNQEFEHLKNGGPQWPNLSEMLKSKVTAIQKSLKEFPSEWTIIQMSREVMPFSYLSTRNEILRNNSPIYLSLLKYPYWEYNNHNPICIKIAPNREFNIFADVVDFIDEYSKLFEMVKDRFSEKSIVLYRDLLKTLMQNINKLIGNMKTRLGPLAHLFRGKSKDSAYDDAYFKNLVRKFDKKLTKRQILLVFLFTRGSSDHLDEQFMEYVGTVDRAVSSNLNLFISEYKQENPIGVIRDNFPCIMIIDELLDQLPWEMILPFQEFTRIFSFSILEKLYEKHKSEIQNGYLLKKLSTGNWIINPDNDLPHMESRMVAFSEYFRPEWKTLVKKVPSSEECKELLQKCDVYIYSGHGSGLKYLRGRHLSDLVLDCVVFLFGCSSVAYSSNGLNNSMIGPHIYYHLAHCPTIVGNLYTVTDFNMDLTTAILLTRFMPVNYSSMDDFKFVNRKLWQTGKIEFSSKKTVEPEYNLTKLLTMIRCDEGIPIAMKTAIVVRGLPLYNIL